MHSSYNYSVRNILADFKLANFLQDRQITKLKTSPKFGSHYTVYIHVHVHVCIHVHTGVIIQRVGLKSLPN